jgi:hypothetical protein
MGAHSQNKLTVVGEEIAITLIDPPDHEQLAGGNLPNALRCMPTNLGLVNYTFLTLTTRPKNHNVYAVPKNRFSAGISNGG